MYILPLLPFSPERKLSHLKTLSRGVGGRRVAAAVGPFVFYLGLVVFCLSLDYRVFA